MVANGPARLIFVSLFVVNCVVWSQSRYSETAEPVRLSQLSPFGKKDRTNLAYTNTTQTLSVEPKCHPTSFPINEQCAHVKESCPISDTVLSIQYVQSYFCTQPASLRPLSFIGLAVWLLFLFSTLGISASDFFCPNLATISQLLGLDENVAGVTLLAFGNGSPDVFSTYSAMRSNSGSLAIGELLGAASFIISCVVGSMCIIKPFKVEPYPFLRDVGFFTVAVTLLIVILHDGKLQAWESGVMVALYMLYVTVVIVGSWWERRRERKRRVEALIRSEYDPETPSSPFNDEQPYQPYRDEPSGPSPLLTVPTPTRPRAISYPDPPRLGLQTDLPLRSRSRSPSPSPRLMPSFSLISALEFRQVVSSLQNQAATPSLGVFDSPLAPYARFRSHPHTPLRTPSHHSAHEPNPWDAALLPLNERLNSPSLSHRVISNDGFYEGYASEGEGSRTGPIPSISHTPATPTEADSEAGHFNLPTRFQRFTYVLKRTFSILFPTLRHFCSQSITSKVVALFAAPAVMALTLTLPVIVTPYDQSSQSAEKTGSALESARLIDFEEEGVERALIAEEEVQEEIRELKFNKWLMAAQCVCGPLFCVGVLFSGVEHQEWLLVATCIAGLAAGTLVAVFADRGEHPTARLARCMMGFFVAIVWIMAIADEVVNVLRTFGFVFGLSDAIIGLTIFAVGNSTADLVANMSVAVFAPIMGFSACFGGPMLNMLLGVGLSGTYIIHHREKAYDLHFPKTLLMSSSGLLALLLLTLFFVPWNGFFLTRRWGVFLILSYVTIMTLNIIVETRT